ncbi:MAG: CBS domain-containing protein [Epsilonproteobacteria bacterium]|nr:CBS domain-containing protein [Campylobacterota bacterium]
MEEIKDFLGGIHPFEILTPAQLQRLVQRTDIDYFVPGEKIPPRKFYVILKGAVQEIGEDGPIDLYKEKDSFDIKWILDKPHNDFLATQETIAYAIDKETFLEILQENKEFKNFFFQDISHKLTKLHNRQSLAKLGELLFARVKDLLLQTPTIVDASTPIHEAIKQMPHLLIVQKNTLFGVVSSSDLKKFFIQDLSKTDPISSIATFPALEVQSDEFLFDALLLMTRKNIKHLLVKEDETLIGTLEITEILSYLSNQTYLLARRIEKASDLKELKEIVASFQDLITILYHKGIKPRYLATLMSELNQKLYAKIASMIFTIPHTLLLLGSEGRDEQILRSDQDNAIMVHNHDHLSQALQEAKRFTQTLLDLGFPPCPGGVMVQNPKWCRTLQGFEEQILSWIQEPREENFIDLAILFDAKAIEDEKPLQRLKSLIFDHISDNTPYLAHMAKGILQFDTPSFFQYLKKEPIDLKKGGIFPIVHGARVLAMQHRITKTNTVERINEISDLGILEKGFATDLIESFDAFANLRLKASLQSGAPTNTIDIASLSKLERDLLKDAFKIVDKFKEMIKYHFRLDMVS